MVLLSAIERWYINLPLDGSGYAAVGDNKQPCNPYGGLPGLRPGL